MGFTSQRVFRQTSMEQFLIDRHAAGSTAGVTVNNRTAPAIPAMHAAVEFAAESIAQLTGAVWLTKGAARERVTTGWQARLFTGPPNQLQDDFTYWHTVQASLDWRGNAYIWKTKDADGRVIARTALHPDQVLPLSGDVRHPLKYQVLFVDPYPIPSDVDGRGTVMVDGSVILHIRGRGAMGELVAPSPIRRFAQSLGLALAKQEHESALMANGASKGLVISFPQGVLKAQADEWKEDFDRKYAGPSNTGRTKTVGGGATVTPISMSPDDLQLIESIEMSVLDVSRITGVPAWLLGVREKTSKPADPEHEMQRWLYYGLGPRCRRIESAHNADPDLFGAGSRIQFGFETTDFVRGDLKTEDDVAHQQVQDGRLLVDEWRIERGRPPLPRVTKDTPPGMIPQITPVGGAPNAGSVTAPVEVEDEDDDEE